jgi:hypothetical protein
LVYEKNTNFCRKLEKIAENNDQNNGLWEKRQFFRRKLAK